MPKISLENIDRYFKEKFKDKKFCKLYEIERSLLEEHKDLADIKKAAKEPTVSFKKMLKELGLQDLIR